MAGLVSAGYGPAGFYEYSSSFSYKKKNPNASPTWKIQFGLSFFGPSGAIRTPGPVNPNHVRYQLRYTRILIFSIRINVISAFRMEIYCGQISGQKIIFDTVFQI